MDRHDPGGRRRTRKVVQGKPEYLRPEEVTGLMAALDRRWRPLFATAVLTGMPKGELLGLRKTDVNLPERTIIVARSYDPPTTRATGPVRCSLHRRERHAGAS